MYFTQILNLKSLNLKIPVCICFLLINSFAYCATRFWVSSSASNWNNTENWSATCGGTTGASVPSENDEVVFNDGGVGNCLLDVEVRVLDFEVGLYYTGMIYQISHPISISGKAAFYGGSLIGGSNHITVNGKFHLAGSQFISTSGVLELKAEALFSAGHFEHNRGTVRFSRPDSFSLTGIKPEFYTLNTTSTEREFTLTPTENVPKESRYYLSENPQKPSNSFTH